VDAWLCSRRQPTGRKSSQLEILFANTEWPPPFGGALRRLSCLECRNRGVDNVNRLGLGLGRTSAGLARMRYVFGSSQCLQGLECGSSPTSGTVFPQVRGFLASDPVDSVHTLFAGAYDGWRSRRVYRWPFLWPVLPSFSVGEFSACYSFIARPGPGHMTCFEPGERVCGGLLPVSRLMHVHDDGAELLHDLGLASLPVTGMVSIWGFRILGHLAKPCGRVRVVCFEGEGESSVGFEDSPRGVVVSCL
jgi:hypothetical protein